MIVEVGIIVKLQQLIKQYNLNDDEAADLNTTVNKCLYSINIHSSVNLNDYTTPGLYYFAKVGVNAPAESGINYRVLIYSFADAPVQIAIINNTGEAYIRLLTNYVWTVWRKMTN